MSSDDDVVFGSLLVLTGQSGAGRTLAADHLRDLGWRVVDLPPTLVRHVPDIVATAEPCQQVALSLGAANGTDIADAVGWLRNRVGDVRVLYLEAPTPVLVRRFETNRRPHPLSGNDPTNLVRAIDRERGQLAPVRNTSELVFDTGSSSVRELRRKIGSVSQTVAGQQMRMQMTVMSFGYRHGLPLDADIVLDCRFLPNPYWVETLRPHSGLDAEVRDFVLGQPTTPQFLDGVEHLLAQFLPAYTEGGRAYLTIALGSTGGRHRSVAVAERVAADLRETGYSPAVLHRDVDR